MIGLILIIILNIILEYNLPYTYHNLSYFTPMLFIILIPFLNKLIKDKKIYFIVTSLISLIYDLLYSDKLFLIFISYLVVIILNFIFYRKKEFNIKNLIITNILSIIIYDSIIFFSLKIIDKYNYEIHDLLYKITHNIFLNIIITFILYYILCRKKKNKKK